MHELSWSSLLIKLDFIIRQIVQLLRYQQLKHHHNIEWLWRPPYFFCLFHAPNWGQSETPPSLYGRSSLQTDHPFRWVTRCILLYRIIQVDVGVLSVEGLFLMGVPLLSHLVTISVYQQTPGAGVIIQDAHHQ